MIVVLQRRLISVRGISRRDNATSARSVCLDSQVIGFVEITTEAKCIFVAMWAGNMPNIQRKRRAELKE
jgi:carbonic anhydrase/acetyltransferase-like protein (isoleucine patch superfamily)